MGISDQIIGVESGGDPSARNPNSSAAGAGQFLSSTWLDMLAKHRPDLTGSPEELLGLRNDPSLSREMTAAYAADNSGILKQAGLPVTPGNQYLAHFAGPQGAIGLLNADPSAPAGAILGPGVVRANPFLAHMTAGDVAAWADRKMGGAGRSAPMSIAGPQAAAGESAPAPAQSVQPAAPAPQASPAAPPQFDMAALSAVPQLQNILQPPRLILGRPAPFSLGARA
jgi:hypothetical protein